jgi:hypothetical protein
MPFPINASRTGPSCLRLADEIGNLTGAMHPLTEPPKCSHVVPFRRRHTIESNPKELMIEFLECQPGRLPCDLDANRILGREIPAAGAPYGYPFVCR